MGNSWVRFEGLALLSIVLYHLSCTTGPSQAGDSEESDFFVHFSGCTAVFEGPRCEVPSERKLTFWVKTTSNKLNVFVDNREVSAPNHRVNGGISLEVLLPEGAGEIRVEEFFHSRKANRGTYKLLLVPEEPIPSLLEQARELKRQGAFEEALQLIGLNTVDFQDRWRAELIGLQARIERALGNSELAEDLYRQAISYHRAAKNISGEINDSTALVYVLIQKGRRFS